MADPKQRDPEVDSEFARGKRAAQEAGTAPGIDPKDGSRAAITYRQIFNETNGDERRAREIWDGLKRAGGYGDVGDNQALDIRSLERSVEDHKKAISEGVDLQGRPLDLYGKRQMEQQQQHQDNLVNQVGEALEKLKKG